MRKGMFLEICATEGCDKTARYMAIPEANKMGSAAPYRCTSCCNAINEFVNNVKEF